MNSARPINWREPGMISTILIELERARNDKYKTSQMERARNDIYKT